MKKSKYLDFNRINKDCNTRFKLIYTIVCLIITLTPILLAYL